MGNSLCSHHAVVLIIFLYPSHSNVFPFFLSLNFKISILFCCAAHQLGCIKYMCQICLSVGDGRYFFGKKNCEGKRDISESTSNRIADALKAHVSMSAVFSGDGR